MLNRLDLFFMCKKLSLDDKTIFIKNEWIFDFFEEQLSTGTEFWLKDSKFCYKDKVFYFTHSVFSRLRKEEHQIFGRAYEIVSNNVLAEGGSGKVFDILYTISKDKRSYQCKDHHRVIKLFRDGNINESGFHSLHKEFNVIRQIEGRGAKSPTLNKAFVMKKIEGINWWDQSDIIDKLTKEEKKYLCIALLKAYQEQVYNINLIHGDIKKGNILIKVNYEKPLKDRFTINIVDFGSSSFISDSSPTPFSTALDLKILHNYCFCLWDKTELDKLIDLTSTSLKDRIKILEEAVLTSTEYALIVHPKM